ncbi:MAG: PD-(D/E)XK nuclease domain-containing protein, partial [Treponema sp.]|nr:PD-(D/E)XK nuclease domain-containing protein [Treponema sp.]
DMYLQRNPRLPDVKYEWVWELKYLKKEDSGKLEAKRTAAAAQLEKYRQSSLFSSRTDVKYAALIFIGKDRYEVCEY